MTAALERGHVGRLGRLLGLGDAGADSARDIINFSSRGPTDDGRIKPDLSGPDGVSNDVIGGGFFGTSAAAPHGTGAAALIKGAAPSATPDQIKAVLLGRSVDAGAPGPDNQFGYGRLALGSVPNAAAMNPAVAQGNGAGAGVQRAALEFLASGGMSRWMVAVMDGR